METQTPPVPPPPPFATPVQLEDDELDVDVEDDARSDDDPEAGDTVSEQLEDLGEYPSLSVFFCCQLEELVHGSVQWLLTCLDMQEVQRRFEGNGRYRYMLEGGRVYRVAGQARVIGRSPWR